ncbi:hypothetical protein [Acidovorax sp. SDU_ACID1]|uniref:hypothetical protein n=1 Tax=Acidovorax sp. SDU_ACID1 TaxID=3136632 RepID=UPI003872CA24
MKQPLLAEAINKRQLVELRYSGWSRSVEPHTYGVDSKGEEKLLCWQISGGSDSGERQGWKLLNISDIRATTMSEVSFPNSRPGYARDKPPMRRIYAQL